MPFAPAHIGLYFGEQAIEVARQKREERPQLDEAWRWLLAQPGDIIREEKPRREDEEPVILRKPVLDGIAAIIEGGFRYRFADDTNAAEQAAAALQAETIPQQETLPALMQAVATAQTYELLHPVMGDGALPWREDFIAACHELLAAHDEANLQQRLWAMTLRIACGILTEDEAQVEAGATIFRDFIDTQIHPDGYIKPIAKSAESGQTFLRQTSATTALTLAAEAATQAGIDLWAYDNRGITPNTAASYLVFYYFYPQNWKWETGVTEDDTKAAFDQYGAFVEMTSYRAYTLGVEVMLEQIRPFFSPLAGGLTTLSHFYAHQPPKNERKGLFARLFRSRS